MSRNPTVLSTISILFQPFIISHYTQIFSSGTKSESFAGDRERYTPIQDKGSDCSSLYFNPGYSNVTDSELNASLTHNE